jgi:GGDEF domain-containing protein
MPLNEEAVSTIEFENDGVTDSLTGVMSPSLFHENLKREIARASRQDHDLAVISISVKPRNFQSVSLLQEELIRVAERLHGQLRGGDFFARISDLGFWALLRVDESETDAVIQRLGLPNQKDLDIYVVARKKDGYDEWIKRIDLVHFH